MVVDDVDAANKADLLVDHCQLAVQPAQVAPRQAEAAQRTEDLEARPALAQALGKPGRHVAGAETVHHQVHGHAPPGGTDQRVAHRRTDRVVGVNVGL